MNIPLMAAIFALFAATATQASDNVVTYHNSLDRHGDYVVPGLTLNAAANMHLDKSFSGQVSGNIYAQPLYWKGSSGDEVIVATESNIVYALDATSGAVVWQTQLAPSVQLSKLPCGNINPSGITGTPAIDPTAGVVYLDALTNTNNMVRHMLYALSLTDGSIVSGWPLDVEAQLKAQGVTFLSRFQGERGAVLLFHGYLYVSYGGNDGDCGDYHGRVIQVDPAKATIVANWATRAVRGGIWAQGGIAGDGQYLYATTGNTKDAVTWSDGEAIIRLKPGLVHSTSPKDFFTPSDWQELDSTDKDLGGTEALPLDIQSANGAPAKRVIALGKDGNAYLADRSDLGGIGGQLALLQVSTAAIRTAPAVYSTSTTTMLAFTNAGSSQCASNNMTMLAIAASGTSPISVMWCTAFSGRGAPIITTTDGTSDPIVWVVGASGEGETGDKLLHGFNALNGQSVYAGTDRMSGLQHFETIVAANRHLYIGAANRIYAFTF